MTLEIDNTYITIWRKIENWEWYTDANTFRVFFHLLLKANHKDTRWHGIEIKRGQRLTSLSHLASELNIGVQSVRTAIKNLETTGELTRKTTNKYTLIDLKNYNLYQLPNTPTNKRLTNNQHTANNKQECNNEKNEKKSIVKFIPPSIEEVRDEFLEKANEDQSDIFFNFYESKDWYVGKNKMRSWKSAVSGWISRNNIKKGDEIKKLQTGYDY